MNPRQADRYAQAELDREQKRLSAMLDFSDESLYTSQTGDIIYTLDVLYKNGHAQVGIDISAFPDKSISTEIYYMDMIGDYIPGYFSFYEGPVLVEAIQHISIHHPAPQVIIVDGHGLAHPRKFGLACYVGLKTGLPCIGVAKSTLLAFDEPLNEEKNSEAAIWLDKEIVGIAYRSQFGIKPIFISQGHKISMKTCKDIIKGFIHSYRLPENIRRADAASRKQ